MVYYTVAAAPFALVFYLCRGYFPGWPDAGTIAAFLLSLVLLFLLGYLLECTIGMIGFWFLEVSSLVFIFMLLSFFFSGQMFPLDMLPGAWGQAVEGGAAAISGLFSRQRPAGQDHRPGVGPRPVDRSGLGARCSSGCVGWSSGLGVRCYSGFGG